MWPWIRMTLTFGSPSNGGRSEISILHYVMVEPSNTSTGREKLGLRLPSFGILGEIVVVYRYHIYELIDIYICILGCAFIHWLDY